MGTERSRDELSAPGSVFGVTLSLRLAELGALSLDPTVPCRGCPAGGTGAGVTQPSGMFPLRTVAGGGGGRLRPSAPAAFSPDLFLRSPLSPGVESPSHREAGSGRARSFLCSSSKGLEFESCSSTSCLCILGRTVGPVWGAAPIRPWVSRAQLLGNWGKVPATQCGRPRHPLRAHPEGARAREVQQEAWDFSASCLHPGVGGACCGRCGGRWWGRERPLERGSKT